MLARDFLRSKGEAFGVSKRGAEQRVLILVQGSRAGLDPVLEDIRQTCRYARIEFDVHDIGSGLGFPDLSGYSCIVLATHNSLIPPSSAASKIDRFVRRGGGLVSLISSACQGFADIMGCKAPYVLDDDFDGTAGPVRFLAELFPGLKGHAFDIDFITPICLYLLDEQAGNEIVAENGGPVPIAWRRKHGDGRVFVWNTDMVFSRVGRGLLLQSIMDVHAVSVRGIANVGIVWVDDFPAGVTDRKAEPVLSEFGCSYLEFLEKVWWPDMLALADAYGVRYSFATIFAYDERVRPPFDFGEWELETTEVNGTSVPYSAYFAHSAGAKGELGLHGYNHVPLSLAGWKSKTPMQQALRKVIERWQEEELGPTPVSYVPPINQYDAEGIKALTEVVPELRFVCGSYEGEYDRGGREFGEEPWNPDLFCVPRVTYGYKLTDIDRLKMISIIASLGAWTHFLHPDDIIDTETVAGAGYAPRNPTNKRWRDTSHGSMRDDFKAWLDEVKANYPWLRYKESSAGGDLIREHLNNQIRVLYHDDSVEVQTSWPCDLQVRIAGDRSLIFEARAQGEVLHYEHLDGCTLLTLRMLGTRAVLRYGNLDDLTPESAHGL